jgi:ribose transport system substrate-binding protein
MYMLLDANHGKKLEDPTYTGLDVCTPENVNTCLGGGS